MLTPSHRADSIVVGHHVTIDAYQQNGEVAAETTVRDDVVDTRWRHLDEPGDRQRALVVGTYRTRAGAEHVRMRESARARDAWRVHMRACVRACVRACINECVSTFVLTWEENYKFIFHLSD